jgi:hypothetical protein
MRRNLSAFQSGFSPEEETDKENYTPNKLNNALIIPNPQNEKLRNVFQKLNSLRNPFFDDTVEGAQEELSSIYFNNLQMKIEKLSLKLEEQYIREQTKEIMAYME